MSDSHYYDIASAIRARLVANWTTTPILFENLDEAQIQTSGENPQAFIVCEILYLTHDQMDIGALNKIRYRTRGVIKIHILTPSSMGDGLALEYADTIAAIFRSQTFAPVVCSSSGMRSGGERADAAGRYWRVTVGADFYADKVFDI